MTKNNRLAILNDNGAPVQPAGDSSQAALDAQLWPIVTAGNVGTGVVAGGVVSAAGGMNVTVAGCTGRVLGVPVDTAAFTFTLTAADPTYRRFDLFVIRGGVLNKLIGIPDAIPCFPALQKDAATGELTDIALASVLVLPGATAITAEDITLLGVPPAGAAVGINARKAAHFTPHRNRVSGDMLWSYNGQRGAHLSVPIQDNCYTTSDGDVYTIYVNELKQITVTQTLAGEEECSSIDLASFTNDPFETGTAWSTDSHDFMVIAVSADGHVHVAGNMHAQTLKYARCQLDVSNAANKRSSFTNLANWTYPTALVGPSGHRYLAMVGSTFEVQTGTDADGTRNGVTYPNFVRISTGDLIFIYRWGASGKGDTYMNRWDTSLPGPNKWVRVGKMLDELNPVAGTNWNAYPQKFVPGPNADIHMMFCQRNTGNEATNKGMYYVHFTELDGAGAAEDSAGVAKVLPIRPDDPSLPANRRPEVASASGIISFPAPDLLNNGGACIDRDGHIHACISYGTPYNNFHLWRDATGWHQEQITTKGAGRNMIFATADGRVFIVGRGNGTDDGLRCWECTPGGSRDTFLLATFDAYNEITFDTRAMDEHGLFRCFIGQGQGWYEDPGDNDISSGDGATPPVAHWAHSVADLTVPRAIAGFLTVDLTQIDAFRNGLVNLPGIKTIATSGYRDRAITEPIAGHGAVAGDGWVTAGAGRGGATPPASGEDTTARVASAGPIIAVGRVRPGRLLFVRQTCMLYPIASGQWAATCIAASRTGIPFSIGNGAALKRLACVWADSSNDQNNMLTTTWCALSDFDATSGVLGWITSQIWPNGGGGAWIGAQMIELGELDCG